MVDVSGHLGMALVWLASAWVVVDDPRTAAAFVAVGVPFGLLPDVDLYLRYVLPTVKHHGVFHTVVAVVAMTVVLAPVFAVALRALDARVGAVALPDAVSEGTTAFAGAAILVAGLAHVFTDVLSAPDTAEALEPFWPLYPHPLGIDVVYYDAPLVNYGLLAAGVALNVALWRWRTDR
ncbi:metal-dependent hydrolase [Halorubellus sp. PRR65]|uniref:metal-dependent hydrolase n=1 Tax=Halorubellus sp. PRR65 TaxID=3098148 RepID=UPI002B25C031|nr:metal-dependent hydrolase [Halorubellus sp. PRR65]